MNLALLCVTITLLLLGAEWTVGTVKRSRVVRRQRALERLTGTPFDPRTIPEVVADLRATGVPAVPSIVPRVMIEYTLPETDPRSAYRGPAFPLNGISRRPTVDLCNEGGRYPVYPSDRYGFMNPPAIWDSVPMTLVLIGDSFTHGYCVPSDSAMPSLLRRRWPRTLNLGSPGSGPLSELGTLIEFGLAEHPRLVVWVYYENDLQDLASERRQPVLARYLVPGFSQHLRDRQAEVDSALLPWVDQLYAKGLATSGAEEHGLRHLLTLSTLRNQLAGLRRPAGTLDPRSQVPLLRQVLLTARDRLAAQGGRLVVVFLPSWGRYFEAAIPGVDQARLDVLTAARGLRLPVVDLTAVFAADGDRPRLFGRRQLATAHYSSAGYALVARTIEQALDSLRLLPVAEH